MEVTIPYADLKAVIGILIVGAVGIIYLYIWCKKNFDFKLGTKNE